LREKVDKTTLVLMILENPAMGRARGSANLSRKEIKKRSNVSFPATIDPLPAKKARIFHPFAICIESQRQVQQ
jgi:hypothetical protein